MPKIKYEVIEVKQDVKIERLKGKNVIIYSGENKPARTFTNIQEGEIRRNIGKGTTLIVW